MCIKKNLSSRALEKEIKNNAFERLSLADEYLDNISEEKLAKIIKKELEIFLLELGCN